LAKEYHHKRGRDRKEGREGRDNAEAVKCPSKPVVLLKKNLMDTREGLGNGGRSTGLISVLFEGGGETRSREKHLRGIERCDAPDKVGLERERGGGKKKGTESISSWPELQKHLQHIVFRNQKKGEERTKRGPKSIGWTTRGSIK